MRKWIPAVVILGLVVSGFFLIRPAPELGSFKMPDGTVVEVVKITTGPVHRFRYDNRWQDYLGYALPKPLREKLKPHILERTAILPGSVVWTKGRLATGTEITVADESGVEVAILGGSYLGFRSVQLGPPDPTVEAQLNSNVTVAGWWCKPLPHHAREIGLTFYDRSRRVGYFKVPNPAYRRVRTGRPESLPMVKTAGNVQVMLSRVDVTRDPDNPSQVDWDVSAEVLRNGAPHPNWKVEGVDVFSDGEVFAQTAPVWLRPRLGDRHPFPGLWPDNAWTLRLWAVQYTNFTLDQIWILNDVALTNTVEAKRENSERRLSQGKTVEFRRFNGPERNDGTDGFISGKSRNVTVYFAAPPADEGARLTFLRGRDDQGRTLDSQYGMPAAPFRTWPTPGQPYDWVYGVTLHPLPDAKSLTLEFAVHQARSVDFVVKPTLRQ